jgi:hypothetical protein
MASLRKLVIGLLRLSGETKVDAACRRFATQPEHRIRSCTKVSRWGRVGNVLM